MATKKPGPGPHLPLPPVTFHVLVSLADEERHGYSIMQEVAERTAGEVKLHAGTLYATLKRLLADGLIRELDERPGDGNQDTRRRYYRLTPVGRAAAQAELRRLAELVRQARASGLSLGSR
jgi:DNA-binding PadR family transcriptional regulator